MNDLISKISSYHLFNYLLPGCLFAFWADRITHRGFIQQNILIGFFLYYFCGLVISRLGSLLIEPLLKYVKFLKFTDYKDYIAACKKDDKIETLSESNNMYRTLCALLVLLLPVKGYAALETKYPQLKSWDGLVVTIALLIIFLFSYRKQTEYVVKRIKANQ